MQPEVEAIFDELTADQTAGSFYAALGGRIYEMEAPVNAALPLCVVTFIANPVARDFGPREVKDADIQIDLYGLREFGSEALGDIQELLFETLQGADFDMDGHDRGHTTCIDQGVKTIEDDAIRITSEWRLQGATT